MHPVLYYERRCSILRCGVVKFSDVHAKYIKKNNNNMNVCTVYVLVHPQFKKKIN